MEFGSLGLESIGSVENLDFSFGIVARVKKPAGPRLPLRSFYLGSFDKTISKITHVNSFRQHLQAAKATLLIAMINGEKAAGFIVPAKSMTIYNLYQL